MLPNTVLNIVSIYQYVNHQIVTYQFQMLLLILMLPFNYGRSCKITGYRTSPSNINTIIPAISLVQKHMGASERKTAKLDLMEKNHENNNKCTNDMGKFYGDQNLDDGAPASTNQSRCRSSNGIHLHPRFSSFPHLFIPPVLPPSFNRCAASSSSAETSRQEKWLFWVRFQHQCVGCEGEHYKAKGTTLHLHIIFSHRDNINLKTVPAPTKEETRKENKPASPNAPSRTHRYVDLLHQGRPEYLLIRGSVICYTGFYMKIQHEGCQPHVL